MTHRLTRRSRFGLAGQLEAVARVPWRDREKVVLRGVSYVSVGHDDGFAVIRFGCHNAFVGDGLDIALDRLMGTNGPPNAISHMFVTDDDQAVDLSTSQANPAGGGSNIAIVAVTNKVPAASQEVSARAVFDEGNANFVHQKLGYLNSGADDGSSLINVIGGTGGSSPYDEPFTVDFTSTDEYSTDYKIKLLASAV